MPKRSGPSCQQSRSTRFRIIQALRRDAHRQGDEEANVNNGNQQHQEVEEINPHHPVPAGLVPDGEGAINGYNDALNEDIIGQFIQPGDRQQNNLVQDQENDLEQGPDEEHASNNDSEDQNESDGAEDGNEADAAEDDDGSDAGVNGGESDGGGDDSDVANAGSEVSDGEIDNGADEDLDRYNDQNDLNEGLDEVDNEGNAGNYNEDFLERFGDQPLYTGAALTVRESIAMLLNFMMSHNLTGSTLVDLFSVIQLHCPQNGFIKLSLYKLQKYFNFCAGPVNKKYYCSVCCLGLQSPQDICHVCNARKPISYFVQIPLIPQLKELYGRTGFYNDLQHRFRRDNLNVDLIEDIYDAQLYREHVHQGFLANPQNFSMTYFTDGVPVFKSKNYSFWGFYLTINELPYKLRMKRENTLLAGLWFGPHKPHANLFLNSFTDDFQSLYNGFAVFAKDIEQEIIAKGILLAGVADTPARSLVLNTVSHRGFYGCPACECRGESVRLPNGNDTFAYTYENPLRKRTVDSMVLQARHALNLRNAHIGVKGPTALRLFMPDFVRGTGIDLMHLLQGLNKKFLEILFDSTNNLEGFSLRGMMGVIDEMLLSIKPPKFIHRMPRSVEDLCHWKASEFKAWFFYYSLVIFKEVMRPIYFDHYLKLVIALSYLSASSVSEDMIVIADRLLHEFVSDFENLYGLRYCSINVHMLLHLADCVRELGPTWVYTCFPYESINGEILRVIHGKTNVDSQISRMHWQWLTFPSKFVTLREGPIKDFCFNKHKQLKICERVMESCYVVGIYSTRDIRNRLIIEGLQNSNIVFRHFKTYNRLLKNNQVYVSEKYNRDLKSSSSFVAYQTRNAVAFGTVYIFLKVLQCRCREPCNCPGEHFAIVRGMQQEGTFNLLDHREIHLQYMHQYRMSLEVSAVPVRDLITVCIFMDIRHKIYLARPVNTMELE